MDLQITTYQYGERPGVSFPDPGFYKQLGEEGIRKMVSRHYDLLQQSPIKHLFPINDAEFALAKQNSADFMIQICGGPNYFDQHRGKPMMIKRHTPFTIKPEGRIVWLNCYKQALLELNAPEDLILSFWNYINVFSSWMVNTPAGK
jgi:hemoglobin